MFTIIIVLFTCFQIAFLTASPCVIELGCAECVPDNMPLVTSHRAYNGQVKLGEGEEVVLSCGAGRLLAYPLRATLVARCEGGRYRLPHDGGSLRDLLELGCQENVFEDVLHDVQHCPAPYQGRAYQTERNTGMRHLATLCFDEDRWQIRFAHISSASLLPRHEEHHAPLSLLGNFNHMFDATTRLAAERLYSDELRMNRRLHEMFKHDQYSFADQRLTSGKLLSGSYFEDQYVRVTEFVSNLVPVWSSVAHGNLHHLHADLAALIKFSASRASPLSQLHVYCGTHGVASLRTATGPRPIYLKPERFPVPKYIWCVAHETQAARGERALAVVVTNEPFVAVSEVRDTVACESACGSVAWLDRLRAHRHYETPLYGLTFCCEVHNFTALVPEMPAQVLSNVPHGVDGMLIHLL